MTLEQEMLNHCLHLQGAKHPKENISRPSTSTLRSHRMAYDAPKKDNSKKALQRQNSMLLDTLCLYGWNEEADHLKKGDKEELAVTIPMKVGHEPQMEMG